ncbi:MAG: hypothetical protein K8R79_01400, partial [Calditrichales bacterium]|nr:hypothetical protein [Calditrichales bacterium]
MEFWRHVPMEEKIGQKLYKEYLNISDTYNLFPDLIKKSSKLTLKSRFKNSIVYQILKPYKRKLGKKREEFKKFFGDYFVHDLQWYGMFSYRRVLSIYKFQNIYSFLAEDYIKKLIKSFKK